MFWGFSLFFFDTFVLSRLFWIGFGYLFLLFHKATELFTPMAGTWTAWVQRGIICMSLGRVFFWGSPKSRKKHCWWIRGQKYGSKFPFLSWYIGISRCPLKSCEISRGLWGLGGLTLSLWGVGSYDQHQCGQSTFGARGWGLHVGRNSGCLNRIPAWRGSIHRWGPRKGHLYKTNENVSFFMRQKKKWEEKESPKHSSKTSMQYSYTFKKTSCWLSIMNCHLQKNLCFDFMFPL